MFLIICFKRGRFNFCPEITTKIANLGERIEEVPIDYYGRSKNEGKKLDFGTLFKQFIPCEI